MDYPRPSGLALTGHDDTFEWIELTARAPRGEVIARTSAQIGNREAINAWCQKFRSTAVSHSICVYAQPSRRARYVAPFYLYARSESSLEGAKRCITDTGEQVLIEMDAPPACVHWYFDGNTGFELLIPPKVFEAVYSPWIFPLYEDIATHLDRVGPGFLDLSIYSQDYTWTLPGSRHRQRGLYKTGLTTEEITGLSADQIVAMATSPRPDDLHPDTGPGKYAPWWYTAELKRIEHERTACPQCDEDSATETHGRVMLPCDEAIESAVLADGTRHATYFTLASYWAHLNVHYPEIVARLRAIDNRNPIRDVNDIEKAAEYGCRHPSLPPCDSVLRQYCPKHGCEMARSKQHPTE